MNRTLLVLAVTLCLGSAPAGAAPKDTRLKIALMPIQPSKGVTPELAMVVTDSLAVELQNRPGLSVVTPKDIEAALGFERQKAKVNAEIAAQTGEEVCTDNSCLAEIGGALGVDRMVSGTLTLVGQTYFLTVQSFDPRKASVVGRVQQMAKADHEEELVLAAKPVADKLFGVEGGVIANAPPQKPVAEKPSAAPRRAQAPPQPKPAPKAPPGPPPRNSKLTVKLLEEGETSKVEVVAGNVRETCDSLVHDKPCVFMLPKGYAHLRFTGHVEAEHEVYLANTYHQVAEVTETSMVVPMAVGGGIIALGAGVLGATAYSCDFVARGSNSPACVLGLLGGIWTGIGGAITFLVGGIKALESDPWSIEVKTERVARSHGGSNELALPQVAIDYSLKDGKKSVLASWQF